MWVVMLEACVAFFLLVFIVWWTMYADRPAPKKPAPRITGAEGAAAVAASKDATPAAAAGASKDATPASRHDATGQSD